MPFSSSFFIVTNRSFMFRISILRLILGDRKIHKTRRQSTIVFSQLFCGSARLLGSNARSLRLNNLSLWIIWIYSELVRCVWFELLLHNMEQPKVSSPFTTQMNSIKTTTNRKGNEETQTKTKVQSIRFSFTLISCDFVPSLCLSLSPSNQIDSMAPIRQ